MISLKKLLLLMFVMIFVPRVSAQTITLDTYLAEIQKNHPIFRKETLSSEIETQKQQSLKGSEDWIVEGSQVFFHQEPAQVSFDTPERSDGFKFNASANRAFWQTGGRISTGWQYTFSDQKSKESSLDILGNHIVLPLGMDSFHENSLFMNYSHPLIKNRDGILDRLAYNLAAFDIEVSKLKADENKEKFLLDVSIRFLDWVSSVEELKIANARRELAKKQLNQLEQKLNANLVRKVDVLRAQDDLRIAEQNVVFINSQREAKVSELATLAEDGSIEKKAPAFNLSAYEKLPNLQVASGGIEEKSRLIKTLLKAREQLEHLYGGLKNSAKPEVNLNLSTSLSADDDTFGKSLTLDRPEIAAAVVYRRPLENRSSKADLLKTKLQIKQIEEEKNNITLELQSAIKSILIQANELEKVLELNKQQIQSAGQRTEEELALYNQGQSELSFVIQSQDNEQNARVNYVHNATLYHKLIIQYKDVMDQLL